MAGAGVAAALAGLPAGIQSSGVWIGRRQVSIRFAGEAETATLYTATGLANELRRLLKKSSYHSMSLCGRDVLGNVDYIAAVFAEWEPPIPVAVDTDGQRPDALERLGQKVRLVQVGLDFSGTALDALVDRAMQTLEAAARLSYEHALVLSPREETSDGQMLRVVERVASVSSAAAVVVHPVTDPEGGHVLARRWSMLSEQMQLLHGDVRIMLRIPPPAGLR